MGLSDFVSPDSLDLLVTNIQYKEKFGQPVVHLFGRDASNEKYHVEIQGHDPSFFIPVSEYTERLDNHHKVKSVEFLDENGDEYKSLQGETLVRVYTFLPKQVGELRDNVFSRETTYEADVFFADRFLIDQGIKTGVRVDISDPFWSDGESHYRVHEVAVSACEPPSRASERTLTADIEVASDAGFPDAQRAEWPVSVIATHDSYTDEYVTFALRSEEWDDPDFTEVPGTVHLFDEEHELLHAFGTYLQDLEPDLLMGWNSESFDYPYLINRCRNLNVWDVQEWSPLGDVWVSQRHGDLQGVISGVPQFDLLTKYRKLQYHELDSNRLEDVAQVELGHGKLEVDDHTAEWRERPVRFLRYAHRDVEAVVEIERKNEVIDLFRNIREISGALWREMDNNINIIDMMCLRRAKDLGIRLPTASKPDTVWYHGAFVFTPKAGVHYNVVYPDLSSLYPNLIRQMNMSPETVVGTRIDLAVSQYSEEDCFHSYIDTRPVKIAEKGEPVDDYTDGTYKAVMRPRGSGGLKKVWSDDPEYTKVYYLKPEVKQGFVSGLVQELIDLNKLYEGKAYEAVKRIRNCFSGDTEVMTPVGVVNIKDLEVGDDVYSFNPDTGEVEIKPVTRTFEYSGEHDMITINNSRVDFSVTDNHRMLVKRPRHSDDWEFTNAGDLNKWTNYELPHGWEPMDGNEVGVVDLDELAACATSDAAVREYRSGCKWIPRYYDGDDFLELLSWFITEGSIYTTKRKEYPNGNIRGESTTISIAQEGEYREDISRLLDRMRLDYYEDDRSFQITGSGPLAEALTDLCGSGSEEKRIPDMVFSASEKQRERFFETLMKGDGDSRADNEGGNRYTTKSDRLRDDVLRLLTELGYSVSYSKDSGVWRIRFHEGKNTVRMHRDGGISTANGVYCVEVADNHTLLAGRNGKFQFVGQSIYGVFGDKDSYGTGFRLFDERIAEGITLGGRKVLQYTAETFIDRVNEIRKERELIGSDAYQIGGDTDSAMASLPFDNYADVAEEAVEYVNMTYTDFCREQFDTPESYMETEIESTSSRAFFVQEEGAPKGVAKKKRYVMTADTGFAPYGTDERPLIVKGFHMVRSDVAQVTKDLQEYTFEQIMYEDLDDARRNVMEWVRGVTNDIRGGEYPLEKLGKRFGIGQHPSEYGSSNRRPMPWYRGLKYANEHVYGETAMKEGDKPLFWYVTEGHGREYTADTAEDGDPVDGISAIDPSDLPEWAVEHIDREKMIEKTMKDPMEPIFKTLGWDMDVFEKPAEQMALDEAM